MPLAKISFVTKFQHISIFAVAVFDCQWGHWNEWSQCSETCGNGVKTRYRGKSQEAANGGKKCDGNNIQIKECTITMGPCTMDVSVNGLIIGGCILLVIIIIIVACILIYIRHQQKSQHKNIISPPEHLESQYIPLPFHSGGNVANILYEISAECDDSVEMTKIEKSQLKFESSIG